MGAAPCVHRERSGSGLIPCTHGGRREEQDTDKQLIEALRAQVEQLRRRNAALEQSATPTSGRSGHHAPLQSLREPFGSLSGSASARKQTFEALSEVAALRSSASYATTSASTARRRPAGAVVAPGAVPGNLSAAERSRLLQEAAAEAAAAVPLPVGILFPNQTPGLYGTLTKVPELPRVRAMLQAARVILDKDVEHLCEHGPPAALDEPRLAQPLVYIASCIALEVLRSERPEVVSRCQALAGVGVGEFAALYAADVLDFEVGLSLVLTRVQQMMKCAESSVDMLQLKVVGMSLERVRHLCDQVRSQCAPDEVCSVSYAVVPKAHICSGTKEAIERLRTLAQSQSGFEVKAVLMDQPQGLNAGAFQTQRMEEAKRCLKHKLLEALPTLRPPRCPVYFNAMGEALPAGASPTLVVELMAEQLTATVLWEATVRTMIREGVDEMIICGPKCAQQMLGLLHRSGSEAVLQTDLCTV